MRYLYYITLLCFSSLALGEKLSFDKTIFEAEISPQSTDLNFEFPFSVNDECKIEEIKSHCSCMSIVSNFDSVLKKNYRGIIVGKFDSRGREGLYNGKITVRTNTKIYELFLKIKIPTLLKIDKKTLFLDFEAKETVVISTALDSSLSDIKINAPQNLDVVITQINQREFTISVKRISKDKTRSKIIIIYSPAGVKREFAIHCFCL